MILGRGEFVVSGYATILSTVISRLMNMAAKIWAGDHLLEGKTTFRNAVVGLARIISLEGSWVVFDHGGRAESGCVGLDERRAVLVSRG